MSLYIDSNSSSATSWLRDVGEAPHLPSLSLPMCKMRVIAVPASWGCCELENCPARYMLRESWSQQSVRKLKLYKHRALQTLGFPIAQSVKNLPAVQETQVRFLGWEDPLGKIPSRRKWQPTPVFLPGEFHGQRSLVGYSPWSRQESDMT